MKKLLIVFLASFLLANNTAAIKNLIGEEKYKTYYALLKPILNETSLQKTISYLQNNGLLDIFFEKPKYIHPTFVFLNNNPIFNTKTLYDTLNTLGYYYFYPIKVSKEKNFKITIEMKSTHYIDPLIFLQTISQKGCKVKSIIKNKNYTYYLDCKNEKTEATKVVENKIKLINAKGLYWLNPNGFKKILITTSKYDNWYPYVVFYDKNLNILNIIAKENSQRSIYLKIPIECKYIKVKDNFSKVNFKRGIYVKGIQ